MLTKHINTQSYGEKRYCDYFPVACIYFFKSPCQQIVKGKLPKKVALHNSISNRNVDHVAPMIQTIIGSNDEKHFMFVN